MKMTQPQDLNFKTRKEWRGWLKKNYSNATEAWVTIYKKNSKKDGLKYVEAVEEAICYGWIDSKMNAVDEDTFRQRFSPRRKNSIWPQSNKERAMRLINERKMRGRIRSNQRREAQWQMARCIFLKDTPCDSGRITKSTPTITNGPKPFSGFLKFNQTDVHPLGQER
jgi:hypothetical protein